MYKLLNGQTPEVITKMTKDLNHDFNTRSKSGNNQIQRRMKTKIMTDSTLNKGVKLWNKIPLHIKEAESWTIFKNRVYSKFYLKMELSGQNKNKF